MIQLESIENTMKRRTILRAGLGLVVIHPLLAAMEQDKLDAAVDVLQQSVNIGMINAASLYVRQQQSVFSQ